jgi:tRNA modification GTPase
VHRDTIFAVASGAGQAAIAVLRLSGPGCAGIVRGLCGSVPAPRQATLRRLRGADGAVLDRAVVLWFPGPASYTGEDSAELQLHGGRAVIDGVADALTALGARPAEPGEFTERAFLNGRMDLLEAEGIADLIAAETSTQRDQALRQMEGGLGAIYHAWSARMLGLLARQEAMIDFPDEDIPDSVADAIEAEMAALAAEMRAHLADGGRGERLRDGLVFAIVGPPNVGKSTLINVLADRDVAIVSPLAGTTRDVVEARVVLGGVPVTLLDTAGLRDSDDPIEAEGVRRAKERAARADLVLALDDATQPEAGADGTAWATVPVIRVRNKVDITGGAGISARDGTGVDALRAELDAAARRLTAMSGPPALTRARHRAAVRAALDRLHSALSTPLAELRGEDLRLAMRSLGRLTGAVGVEDVLDSVFRQFCIGK